MKKYIISGFLGLVLVFGLAIPSAKAETNDEIIQQLLKMIANLTAQLNYIIAQRNAGIYIETTTTTPVGTNSICKYNSDLKHQSRGDDVKRLQTWLKANGYDFYITDVTGFYGVQTMGAIAAFQKAKGITGEDGFGPRTRAVLNALVRCEIVGTSSDDIQFIYPKGGEVFDSVKDSPLQVTVAVKDLTDDTRIFLYSPIYGNVYEREVDLEGTGKTGIDVNIATAVEKSGVYRFGVCDDGRTSPTVTFKPLCIHGNYFTVNVPGDSSSSTSELNITNVIGKAASNFEIDLNSQAYINIKDIGSSDKDDLKVYIGGIQSEITQVSRDYLIVNTPTDGLQVGSNYDVYITEKGQKSNTVRVKVLSKVIPYKHSVTATAGTGGKISPSGTIYVPSGTNQNFTVTPDSGYKIDSIKVNGESVSYRGNPALFDLINVKSNKSIVVKFARSDSSSETSVKLISPNGGEVFKEGDRHIIKWESKNIPSDAQIILDIRAGSEFNENVPWGVFKVLPSNVTSYSWTVSSKLDWGYGMNSIENKLAKLLGINIAEAVNDKYFIRVRAYIPNRSEVASDHSDRAFTITQSESVSTTPTLPINSPIEKYYVTLSNGNKVAFYESFGGGAIPRLYSLSKTTASKGDTITISGKNLKTDSINIVYIDTLKNGQFTADAKAIGITSDSQSLNFKIGDWASGQYYVYVMNEDGQSNYMGLYIN